MTARSEEVPRRVAIVMWRIGIVAGWFVGTVTGLAVGYGVWG